MGSVAGAERMAVEAVKAVSTVTIASRPVGECIAIWASVGGVSVTVGTPGIGSRIGVKMTGSAIGGGSGREDGIGTAGSTHGVATDTSGTV